MERYLRERSCIKCNCIGASTKYISYKNYKNSILFITLKEIGGPTETMKRVCQNCGYEWFEYVLMEERQ